MSGGCGGREEGRKDRQTTPLGEKDFTTQKNEIGGDAFLRSSSYNAMLLLHVARSPQISNSARCNMQMSIASLPRYQHSVRVNDRKIAFLPTKGETQL